MPKSLRYFLRLTGAFISRFKLILFLGVFFGIAIFIFLRLAPLSILSGRVQRIGLVGKYSTNNLPGFILEMASRGLTKTSQDGLPQADLASSWDVKEDKTTWFFYLKEGEKWQDGKEITTQNLNLNFSDVTVERPDKKTLVLKLKSPFAPFPVVVSRPIFKKGFLGSGLWRVSKVSLAGGYVQKINLTDSSKKHLNYSFYPTEERAKLGFKLGEVDTLMDIYNPAPFYTWKTVSVDKKEDKTKVVAIFFDSSPNSRLLSEKTLRQALAYAVNKDAFAGSRAIGPISPTSWAYNPQVKPYDYDQLRAKKMIDGLAKEVRNNLALKLATTPILLNQAEAIARDWEKVGVKTTLQVSSNVPAEYEALLWVFDIPKDPDQYAFWHSSQKNSNICKYNSPRIDKLLEDGRTELNQEARRKIYLDFQRFLMEDSPAVFLYHPVSYTIKRK